MTQRKRDPAPWEFPAVPTLLACLGIFAVIWPWLILHGTAAARIATALACATLAFLISMAVLVAWLGEQEKRNPRPAGRLQPRQAMAARQRFRARIERLE
jgi:hypothetical protein